MQQPSTSNRTVLTPEQIRRRMNDYDNQIRQGLEDGTIRNVMKRLGQPLVSPKIYFYDSPLLTCCFRKCCWIANVALRRSKQHSQAARSSTTSSEIGINRTRGSTPTSSTIKSRPCNTSTGGTYTSTIGRYAQKNPLASLRLLPPSNPYKLWLLLHLHPDPRPHPQHPNPDSSLGQSPRPRPHNLQLPMRQLLRFRTRTLRCVHLHHPHPLFPPCPPHSRWHLTQRGTRLLSNSRK